MHYFKNLCACVCTSFSKKNRHKFWKFSVYIWNYAFFSEKFVKLPSNAEIREIARQNWEIYQFVEHSAYAHKFYIIFWKKFKNPKSANFPLGKWLKSVYCHIIFFTLSLHFFRRTFWRQQIFNFWKLYACTFLPSKSWLHSSHECFYSMRAPIMIGTRFLRFVWTLPLRRGSIFHYTVTQFVRF